MNSVEPSLVPAAAYDAASDALTLRNCMKGLGTDEQGIISVLAARTCAQRCEIAAKYETLCDCGLDADLKSELSGDLCRLCVALVQPLSTLFAEELRRAMGGAGTDEAVLVELLASRSNRELRHTCAAYERLYGTSLAASIEAETSGDLRGLLLALLEAEREEPGVAPPKELDSPSEQQRPPAQPPSVERAERQAEQLHGAGEARLGTDERVFTLLLSSQSWGQLALTSQAYQRRYGRSLEEAVRDETSGNYRAALLSILKLATDQADYFAERVHEALSGAGTRDHSICRLLVSRAEIDLATVAAVYEQRYGAPLEEAVADDTSGLYGQLLVQLVRGNRE